ncbi:Sensor histidine kinase RcsC [Paenibacillus solanacearum]|uniref:Circadian input-output histidine kinase CikA n=1 Tax=Paenibacillus solanacearum TaxID=2048548 RepID=A0A916K4L5_9BACL|nr:response regulator [Paenibacillus solanacearum]CAG7644028.1 Sensor histidine kinase RcsC [Paenibacillus solanacearum]
MKMKTKLILGFGIMLVLLFVLAAIGVNQLASSDASIRDIYDNRYQKVKLTGQMRSDAADLTRAVGNLLLAASADSEKKNSDSIRSLSKKVTTQMSQIETLFQDNEEKRLASELMSAGKKYLEFKDQAVSLHQQGKPEEANALRNTTGAVLLEDFLSSMTAISVYQEEAMDKEIASTLSDNKRTTNYVLILTIPGVLIGMALILWILVSMTRGLSLLSAMMSHFTNGDWEANAFRYQTNSSDELGRLGAVFSQLADDLHATRKKEEALQRINEDTIWLQSKSASVWFQMQEADSVESMTTIFISELARIVGAQSGAFYVVRKSAREELLYLTGTYAYTQANPAPQFRIGEGLAGQCAKDGQPIRVEIPAGDYAGIRSAFGEIEPLTLTLQPVLYSDDVLGVFELVSVKQLSELEQTLIHQMSETFGTLLNALQSRLHNEELLRIHQALTEELQSQSEELLSQQDELKASNEKLEEQTKVLQASEELLQRQQEELEQANDALMRKTAELEVQIRETEEVNGQLEMAKEALEKHALELAIASRYKSEFLANMSHELRTPLNSLLILSQLMKENKDGNLTDKQVEYADTIYSSGCDLLKLIDDVLDMAKVESGRMDIRQEQVSIGEIAEYVNKSFEPLAQSKALGFDIRVEEGVPLHIHTDSSRLMQILKNMLSNAFKFTLDGEVRLVVRHVSDPRPMVAFAVEDTGIGIPPEKQQMIFEAFQQADGTTSRKYGGTGLGLSVSRQLASLMGGTIELASEEGRGSVFTLWLPMSYGPASREAATALVQLPPAVEPRPMEAAQARHERSLALPGTTPSAGKSVSIADDRDAVGEGDKVLLIIEDDPHFATILLDMARGRGFKAIVALQGDTGLQLAKERLPDAILLDMQLPVVDGWSVLVQLKNNAATRHIPVHVISVVDEIHQGLALGAIAWLQKPTSREGLEEAFVHIQKFVDRSIGNLLIVQPDEAQRNRLTELIAHDDVSITAAAGGEEALARLAEQLYDCIVLDYALTDIPIYELLDRIKADETLRRIPIILYTGTTLGKDEQLRLKKYAESIIIKDVKSPERLLDETALFLHRVEERLPDEKKQLLQKLHSIEAVFSGRKVLLVDDDIRNVFALSNLLEGLGMQVAFAETGRQALELLEREPGFDLVLMDIMMPEMDGYEAMQAIRSDEQFDKLPIIALTAKAMKEDREKCIRAGASDYITKPVHTEQLLSLMRVWLCK